MYVFDMPAAFTKSFLMLEGELTPILVSLVSKDQKAHSMLDSSGVKLSQHTQVRARLNCIWTCPIKR